nr:uncharacterized protein LOC127348852 [Lolium perenne]
MRQPPSVSAPAPAVAGFRTGEEGSTRTGHGMGGGTDASPSPSKTRRMARRGSLRPSPQMSRRYPALLQKFSKIDWRIFFSTMCLLKTQVGVGSSGLGIHGRERQEEYGGCISIFSFLCSYVRNHGKSIATIIAKMPCSGSASRSHVKPRQKMSAVEHAGRYAWRGSHGRA